jgi:hypothetical protein
MRPTIRSLTYTCRFAIPLLLAVRLQAAEPPRPPANIDGEPRRQPAVVEMLNAAWQFDTAQPAHSTLSAKDGRAEFAAPANTADGFTVKLKTVKLTAEQKKVDGEKTILEIPEVLRVRLRRHDALDRNRQNYPAFKMPDGSVPVLEATVRLHSAEHPDWNEMTVGVPLARLKKPEGEHEFVLHFSGVGWTMYADGELLDNDFPFGYPQWLPAGAWTLDGEYVKQAALYAPAIVPTKRLSPKPPAAPVQYWTPPGHNAWVGDVVTFFHAGRYHVFYLYDRRHHQSKFGKGAHYFEHLSTADFQTWTEHEAATPIEEQWECIGTGTPFVFDDKLCLAYGLHTDRIFPPEKTTWPAQWDFLKEHGCTGAFKRASTPGVPAGSSYSVSADGIADFKKSNVMFHPCMNPSVYTDPRGRLRMLANAGSKGIWESESIDGGWRCVSPDFPPGGDCTFFFRWGKFDYIIGGFRNLWSKPAEAPDAAYQDVVGSGRDFYDGLNVPAITEIPGGRFLMAGWTNVRGWGGNLVIRELLQFPDGRIGSKWMDEIRSESNKPRAIATKLSQTTTFAVDSQSFLLSFDVRPTAVEKGRFGISFLSGQGEEPSCELQIRLDDCRAQFAPRSPNGFAPPQKTLREGGAPESGGNYAIENLIDVARPFRVRILVKGDDKLGGSLIDAEIAEKRTMISYRPDLFVRKLLWRMEGVELTNIQVASLVNWPHN